MSLIYEFYFRTEMNLKLIYFQRKKAQCNNDVLRSLFQYVSLKKSLQIYFYAYIFNCEKCLWGKIKVYLILQEITKTSPISGKRDNNINDRNIFRVLFICLV